MVDITSGHVYVMYILLIEEGSCIRKRLSLHKPTRVIELNVVCNANVDIQCHVDIECTIHCKSRKKKKKRSALRAATYYDILGHFISRILHYLHSRTSLFYLDFKIKIKPISLQGGV